MSKRSENTATAVAEPAGPATLEELGSWTAERRRDAKADLERRQAETDAESIEAEREYFERRTALAMRRNAELPNEYAARIDDIEAAADEHRARIEASPPPPLPSYLLVVSAAD